MVKILEQIEKAAGILKSTEQKQKEITALEAGHIWNKLTARYDIIEITNILQSFAKDTDLRSVIDRGMKTIERQTQELEKLCREYGIRMPGRPPMDAAIVPNVETIDDRYIFRRIFSGIQSFLPVHMIAFIQTSSPKLREQFRRFLSEEMDIYDQYFVYGQLKGWIEDPPVYRV